jgi:hypothetical protein
MLVGEMQVNRKKWNTNGRLDKIFYNVKITDVDNCTMVLRENDVL